MTTFDEISTDAQKNWEYWTGQAKLMAVLYFENSKAFGKGHAYAKLDKHRFRAVMRSRRNRQYIGA